MKRVVATTFALAFVGLGIATTTYGCRVGSGAGSVSGDLFVKDCWSGKFDLQPDFFAATPLSDDSLIIRVQRGSDYINFSDGISLLVTNVSATRQAIAASGPQSLSVSLPPSVVPPGVPVTPNPNPATVQLALYLQQTCRPETPGLYAMSQTTTDVPADGGLLCTAATATSAGQCGGDAAPPPATSGSTITFQHLFDASLAEGGDPGSLSADQRLIEATFDVLLGDPRDECPGNLGPPPPCRGHLAGSFRFYFERGKPAQAFP